MISECVEAGDLVLRETARKTYNSAKRFSNLKPPLGLPGPTFKVPIPPVFVPGKGLKSAEAVLETGFPQPELKDEIYAQGLLEVILGYLNLDTSVLDDPFQPQKFANAMRTFLDNNNQSSDQKEIVDLVQALIQQNTNQKYSQNEVQQIREIISDILSKIQTKVNDRL